MLSPFIAPLQQQLLQQARALLGLPAPILLRYQQGPTPLVLRLEWLQKLSMELQLEQRSDPAPACLQAGPVRLHLKREGDRNNPALKAILSLISAHFPSAPTEAFLAAWKEWAPYAHIEDRSLCR